MNKKPIETIMGLIVLIIAASFLFFAFNASDLRVVKGYELTGKFLKVGGLTVGSDLRINGIKIGTVTSIALDKETYEAVLKFNVLPQIKLPINSVFEIAADGLMGDRFVKIQPGNSTEVYKDNEVIKNTKDFKTIEDLVGEVIFSLTGSDDNDKQKQ